MVLYTPLAILFVRVFRQSGNGISVSYTTITASVGVFLGIPLAAAIITRFSLRAVNVRWCEKTNYILEVDCSITLIGLLHIVLVLFAS